MTEVGRRIVNKNGQVAIYLGPGSEGVRTAEKNYTAEEVSKVFDLKSGQQVLWSNTSWTEDAAPGQTQAVIVLNAAPVVKVAPVKIAIIFWGVVLAHFAIGIVVGLILIILH